MEILQKQYLFWDVDLKNVDLAKHKKFIIERILSFGDKDDFKWAVDFYGKDLIKNIFMENSEKFDLKSQNFFNIYFNLSKPKCTKKQLARKQSAFWKK